MVILHRKFMEFIYSRIIPDNHPRFHKVVRPNVQLPKYFSFSAPRYRGDRSEKYGKPVVIIIAATAQSHAEYCVQCMQANPGVTVIGTQSAGTNGNISVFVLPGGIRSCFSGLDWHYPGGWCVQGQGVRFDLEVEPTIVGIRAGRNETREAAVETINDRFPRG